MSHLVRICASLVVNTFLVAKVFLVSNIVVLSFLSYHAQDRRRIRYVVAYCTNYTA
jgi:hypothetical protein